MQNKMEAIKLYKKSDVDSLIPESIDIPIVKKDYVLIEVKAFSVNESEVTSRKGESSPDFSFPRVLGIEGAGIIAETNRDSKFKVGDKVITMMGGLGRSIDGSYAEYMLVKEENVITFESDLPWETIGALPEMLQTAYGSLTQGLNITNKDTLLIRGGSSTVGLMAISLAKYFGATVIATSRDDKKLSSLKWYGADYPILDNQDFEKNINLIASKGLDKVLELVGGEALLQDLSMTKKGGIVCFTGALSGEWEISNFSPFVIPKGIYLTSYAGGVRDLPTDFFNNFLKKIASDEVKIPIAKIYHGLEEVGTAQKNLESHNYIGKHVVIL